MRRPTALQMLPLLALLLALVVAPATAQVGADPVFPGEDWEYVPRDELAGYGWARDGLQRAFSFIRDSANTTGLVVVDRGRVVFRYGDIDELSYIASVRKSVLAMLYGYWVERGIIDLDKTLAELGMDDVGGLLPIEKQATVHHLVTARSGVYHPASYSGDDLSRAPERGSQQPGTYMLYSNWDFNAAGYAFEAMTGRNIYDEVQSQLAIPLEMEDWDRGVQQKAGDLTVSRYPAYPMWFSTRDMARIGYLMLREGRWKDRQLISRDWVERISGIVTPLEEMNPPRRREGPYGYGYMWWVYDGPRAVGPFEGAYSANGAWGQYIVVLPAVDLVVALKTHNVYGRRTSSSMRDRILELVLEARGVAMEGAPNALSAQQPPIVIRDVSVIPMDREEVLAGRTVVLRDGRIESVGPAPATLPADAIVVDGRGRFLIPGLAEMHAHVGSPEVNPRILSLFALNGVTTARGMLGQPSHLALRDSLARGLVFGPRLFTSGPSFRGSGLTPEEARREVRSQKDAGYDLLKIHPGPTRAAFDALAETAHQVGIPFAGHVPADVGLDRAIEARYHTIDHLDGFMEALVPPGATGAPAQGGWFGLDLVPHIDEGRIPGIVERVRAAGVAVVPTQTLMENYVSGMTGDQLAARPEYRYWLPRQVEQWRSQKNARLTDPSTPPAAQRARYIEVRRRLIEALYDAGVPVLLGSDAPQVWNVPGFSTHRELHLYVEAGLSPYEALRTGTVDVARHFGEQGRAGVVRAGARADLILLDANPLEDIENTLRISGVVVNGRWISGEERARRLAELRTGG